MEDPFQGRLTLRRTVDYIPLVLRGAANWGDGCGMPVGHVVPEDALVEGKAAVEEGLPHVLEEGHLEGRGLSGLRGQRRHGEEDQTDEELKGPIFASSHLGRGQKRNRGRLLDRRGEVDLEGGRAQYQGHDEVAGKEGKGQKGSGVA